jgi:hypothetical protein
MSRAVARAAAWLLVIALGGWFSCLIGMFLGLIFVAYGPDFILH